MLVTFVVPGNSAHTYGPYEMDSIPRKDDQVTFKGVSEHHLSFNVGEHAQYSFKNPHYPVVVKVWIYGPVGSAATAHMT